MSKPIKETPVLKGKDAKNFLVNSKNISISPEEKERMMANYQKLKAMEKFDR